MSETLVNLFDFLNYDSNNLRINFKTIHNGEYNIHDLFKKPLIHQAMLEKIYT